MRRIILLVSVVLVMAAMMVVLAGAAMAHSVAAGNPCPSGVVETAHVAVPVTEQTAEAHHNIPCLHLVG